MSATRPLHDPAPGLPTHAFTDEQEAAIAAAGGWTLVSAAAGSGKTSVLTERIVRAVTAEDDAVALGEVLAITFTEKAAGELRARVRTALARSARPLLAREVEQASISTIHAFCSSLLRRHALAAGIDPGFSVLDATEAEVLRETAWDRALGDWLDAGGAPALDVLAAHDVDRTRSAIWAVHDDLRSQGADPVLPPVAAPALDPLVLRLRDAADAAAEEAATSDLPGNASADAALEAVGACRALLAGWAPGTPPPALDGVDTPPSRSSARLKLPAYVAYQEALDACRSGLGDARAADDYVLLGDLLRRYAATYAAAKRAAGGLDFEDLELGARDVLRLPEVSDRVRRRYRRVLVDEFQDTNPVQLELVRLLGDEDVFVVGDEQQSIYGFRHADIEVIRGVRRELEPAGRARSLTGNFRSDPRIVAAINAAFAPVFGPGYVPMAARRPQADPDRSAPVVELLVTDGAAWQDRKRVPAGTVLPAAPDLGTTLPPEPAWRRAEARLLAQRLRDLLDEEPDLRPGDITILVRAYASMPVFEQALLDVGIASIASGGRGYWSQQQVADLVAWLRLVANPGDELALWHVLASPLVGVSTDTLALVAAHAERAQERPWALLEPAASSGEVAALLDEIDAADAARLRAFADVLGTERRAMGRHPLEALVARIVAATRYDEQVLALPGGEQRLANVRKLRRLAAAHEARHGRDLRGFLDAVAAERDAGDREADAPIGLTDDAAVQLMTVHAAKGLEFPVVCVVDTGRRPRSDALLLTVRGAKAGLRARWLGQDGAHEAFDYAELKAAARSAEDDEQRRLLYVALTRAERRLIVSGTTGQGGPLTWLGPALAPGLDAALEAPVPAEPRQAVRVGDATVALSINAPSTVGEVLRTDALAPDRARAAAQAPFAPPPPPMQPPAPSAQPGGSVATVSYSSLGAYGTCGYRWYLERVLGLPRDEETLAPPAAAGLDPRDRGTVAHRLLEALDFAAPVPPTASAVLAAATELGAAPTPAEVEDLRTVVGAFAASPLCVRLAAARAVRREAAFAFALAADAPVLNGVIDVLAWEADGAAIVVDYKTDRLGPQDLEELVAGSYAAQRELYALAALRAGASAVTVAHVFLQRPAEAALAHFTAADAPGLERGIATRLAGIAAGAFPVAEVPHRGICAHCPGRAALCSHPADRTARSPEEAFAPPPVSSEAPEGPSTLF